MEMVRKLWPTPFKIKPKDVVSFIVQLVIFIVICAVIGWAIGLLAKIPILGILFGIILSILVFLDVDAVKK